jgi:hypothetical protein
MNPGGAMSAENFDAILARLLDRRPFQMFTVALKNGERFQVDHARAVAFNNGAAVFVGPGRAIYWFDSDSVSHFLDQSAEITA